MDNNDFRALIDLRDDLEEPENKQLLRRTIRYIERVDKHISKLSRFTRDCEDGKRIDTDN